MDGSRDKKVKRDLENNEPVCAALKINSMFSNKFSLNYHDAMRDT